MSPRHGAPFGGNIAGVVVTMVLMGLNSSLDPKYWEYILAWNRSICTFPRVWNFLMEFLFCHANLVEMVAAV
jgi:hypothetical protein